MTLLQSLYIDMLHDPSSDPHVVPELAQQNPSNFNKRREYEEKNKKKKGKNRFLFLFFFLFFDIVRLLLNM